MVEYWRLTKPQLECLREIASGQNDMSHRHPRRSIATMQALVRYGFVTISTIVTESRPYTGYFITQKGAQALDDYATENC